MKAICPGILQFEAATLSFSGWGEDTLIRAWLSNAGIELSTMRYLDIGAADPKRLSNTYLFYSLGARGVLVEPDPDQARILRAARPRDVVINAGVAFDQRDRARLRRMRSRVFNTFHSEQVDKIIEASAGWAPEHKQHVVDEVEVELRPINQIIEQEMGGLAPNLLSIDAEGSDFEILARLDLARYRPNLICVEQSASLEAFNTLLQPYGYGQVARTPDNLLFLR